MYPFQIHFQVLGLVIQLSAYATFFLLAILFAVIGGALFTYHRGFPVNKIIFLLLAMLLAAIVGARLFSIAVYWPNYLAHPDQIFSLAATGFSLYGGIIAAALTGFLLARALSVRALPLADALSPVLGCSIAIMRVGCFLQGCCFGKESDLPWAVQFPPSSPAHLFQITHTNNLFQLESHPVHPTQLYELIAALLISAAFLLMLRKKAPAGQVTAFFVATFSTFRLLNFFLRAQPEGAGQLFMFYPALYSVLIFFAAFWLWRIYSMQIRTVS